MVLGAFVDEQYLKLAVKSLFIGYFTVRNKKWTKHVDAG